MTKEQLHKARIKISEGLEKLMLEDAWDAGWTPEELEYIEAVRNGIKIPGTSRIIQDRFAYTCSELHIFGDDYFQLKDDIFSTWTKISGT